MSDNNKSRETVAGIAAEMRQGMSPTGTAECQYLESDICTLADRIEAALKREKAEIEAEAERRKPGNAAAMYEAQVGIRALIADEPDGAPMMDAMKATIDAVLAKPPRNCDVGTAEESTRRMEAEYCAVQKSCYESPSGRACPLYKAGVDCRLRWAQMPYAAEEGGTT